MHSRSPSWSVFTALVAAAYLSVAVGMTFPLGIWPLELMEAFAFHGVLLGAFFVGIAVLTGHRLPALLIGAAVILLSFHTCPYLIPEADGKATDKSFSVGVFNVLHYNTAHGGCADAVLSSGSDVACIIEVSHIWADALEGGLRAEFPFSVQVPHSECCWGISLFSRFPVTADSVYHFTRDPVIMATVHTPDGEVDIWAVHTRPPIFPNDTEERNLLMMMVAQEIAERGRPAILAGDLNIVPWAADFKRMAAMAGLLDARRGHLPTFPAHIGVPLIPIDHVLHSPELKTLSIRTVKLPGSDHRGLVASMAWQDGQR